MAHCLGKQAVVIGSGIGGLTAARSLADFFEQVTILECDTLPKSAAHRPGTPQSKHFHALLPGGLQALNSLFPGFDGDLARAGAVPLRVGYDYQIERPGFDPFPKRDLGIVAYSVSRTLLEFVVRTRVEECRNISIRECCRAQEFISAGNAGAVSGVRFEFEGTSETLQGDFFIDASGHGSLTLALLELLRQPLPEESRIGVDIGYATALLRFPDDGRGITPVITHPHYPHNTRAGFLVPIEGGHWIVSLGGRYEDKPPADWDGFLTHAQHIRTSTIYNGLRHAKRPAEIARFGFKSSRWRHFEQLRTFPPALLPFADAISRFNPIYGQGMSVAATEAVALRRLLAEEAAGSNGLTTLSSRFFAEAQNLIQWPWQSAALPDFIHPRTEGERPQNLEEALTFFANLLKLAVEDPSVHKLMIEVQCLLKSPAAYHEAGLMSRMKQAVAAS